MPDNEKEKKFMMFSVSSGFIAPTNLHEAGRYKIKDEEIIAKILEDVGCQHAFKNDPLCAFKFDPPW